MKTIGLIGGMSWESSSQYYRSMLLVGPDSVGVPLFDTTSLHAAAAVDLALAA